MLSDIFKSVFDTEIKESKDLEGDIKVLHDTIVDVVKDKIFVVGYSFFDAANMLIQVNGEYMKAYDNSENWLVKSIFCKYHIIDLLGKSEAGRKIVEIFHKKTNGKYVTKTYKESKKYDGIIKQAPKGWTPIKTKVYYVTTKKWS